MIMAPQTAVCGTLPHFAGSVSVVERGICFYLNKRLDRENSGAETASTHTADEEA
jgi:hypothetical protein